MARLCLSALLLLIAAAPAQRRDPLTGMAFVLVPAGTFVMGSPESERNREAQERPHPVTIAKPFYLGIYEVTQAEWTKIIGSDPSRFAGCLRCPVERVSYDDIRRFLARLNQLSSWPGFRLPTRRAARCATPIAHRTTARAWDSASPTTERWKPEAGSSCQRFTRP